MKRRAFSTLFGLELAFSWTGPASAEESAAALALPLDASDVAERVVERYAGVDSFRARFKQRAASYQRRASSGIVTFARPDKMSWRYTDNGNRVVSDGTLIKIYEKENKQMYEQQLAKTQYPAALSFLTGHGKLEENFKFSKKDSKQMKFESGYVLAGDPLRPTTAYERVLFYVDAQTYRVRRVLIIDAQGNRNRFDFVTSEVNIKPPKNEFAFNPPPGTQIFHSP